MSFPAIAPALQTLTPPPSISARSEDVNPRKLVKKARRAAKAPERPLLQKAMSARKGDKEKAHKRSREGCYTCRLRRKKCDETKPICKACKNLKVECEYNRPVWWNNDNMRRNHKEVIKELIKSTKLRERGQASVTRSVGPAYTPPSPPPTQSAQTPDALSASATPEPSLEPPYLVKQEFELDGYMPFPQKQEPDLDDLAASNPFDCLESEAALFEAPFWPESFEVDVKTESEVFVNDVAARKSSRTTTYNVMQNPVGDVMLPSLSDEKWLEDEFFSSNHEFFFKEADPSPFLFPHPPVHVSTVEVEDRDRPLLDDFFDHVVRLLFPVLEAKYPGSVRAEVILPAIEANKCYLHCCLSNTGVHMRAVEHSASDTVDNDILRHRYQTVSELCKAMNGDGNLEDILQATLAMIFLQCNVGRPDDELPNIAWHQHFQAAIGLIHRLDLSRKLVDVDLVHVNPNFNMTVAAWIDIIGSTMLGQTPQFSNTYRTKLFNGSPSGFAELMGCEDRVMYLIAEIACLDALKNEGQLEHLALCEHITNLAKQLDQAEPQQELLANCLADDGTFQPRQLERNITALFCIAARIYLCSLVPGFQRNQPATIHLIARAGQLLDLIPGGRDGFDRALVWPLLICGSYSVPNSTFRAVLARRMELLTEQAEYGSFGKMVRLLQEVWRAADGVVDTSMQISIDGYSIEVDDEQQRRMLLESLSGQGAIHWRDVMRRHGWEFLLL